MTGSTTHPHAPAARRGSAPPEAVGAVAHFAGWEVDLPTRHTWWSAQAFAMFEMTPGPAPSIEQTIGYCLPEYRATLAAAFDTCAREGAPFDQWIVVMTAAGRRLGVHICARALRAADGAVIRIQGAFRQIAQPNQPPDDTPKLAARLANTLDSMSEAFFTMDTALRFTYLNPEAAQLLQRGRTELLGKLAWEEFPQAVGGPSYHAYARALREQCPTSFEEYYIPLKCWFEVRCYPTEDGLAVYFHDITERKQARNALKLAHRALQMLSRCNHVLVHAARERELIDEICRITVEVGGYRMAWVGYAEDDAAHTISIAAHAGNGDDIACLRQLPLGWSADDAAGCGPAGLAIRSGNPVMVADMANDLRFAATAEAACGYGGAIYLPLLDGTAAFGLISLYAQDMVEGDADEIRLLQELAENLAFGITTIRARIERERIQAAVTKVAASVSNDTGEHFFEQLATTMAEAVGASGGFVARLLATSPPSARTVIAVVDGVRIADFDYVIGDSPCQFALENKYYMVTHGVDGEFPASPAATFGAKAYGCWRLNSSAGKPIGVAFVVFRKVMARSEFVSSTLQIFAARAAAELERLDADASLRTQASLLDKAQDAIIVRSIDDRILFWNKSAERMYGWPREQALGQRLQDLLHDDPAMFAASKEQTLATGHWNGEATRRCRDASLLTVQVGMSLISNDAGAPEALLSINTDITARKAAEREIERLAFYDPTTGLPNRLLLLDRLQHAISISERSGVTGALLFIDLDNFKSINDTLGHDKGDQLLQQVATRLRACIYEIDTVARFGGDEFVVLIENLSRQRVDAATQARHICEKILAALAVPIMLDGFVRHSTASIGVTLFDNQQCSASELLKQADMAMYKVKAAGRNGARFFDPEMQTVVTARAALEADLRHALQHDEFLLHYQPQIDCAGVVTGAEALIRWHSASRGMVSPACFIPTAEETGLILPIGLWVLEQACAQLARWALQPALAHLSVSVNVSARQLHQAGFVDQVSGVLAQAGADPQRLKLEITESLLVNDIDSAIATMADLKARGVGFSLDDFGTGYSSLSYLKRLPLDQLKIDQSFVRDLLADSPDAAIAQAIIALGRRLKLHVIAEGVETAEQHRFLAEHGCHGFQGYLFSRPVPVAQFEQFARAHGGA
ncbi:MAG: EAL domain-containing protein [Pseudomonadota bacterium]|nr:EAL domain-containing protein [Pseudomonadota bacterium]